MLYRFKSKATGPTLMLQPQAEQFLRTLGREPAARGIIEPGDMSAALQALRQAVEDDDRLRAGDGPDDGAAQAKAEAAGRDPVSLRRRMWPMMEMLERAKAADEPIVWGV